MKTSTAVLAITAVALAAAGGLALLVLSDDAPEVPVAPGPKEPRKGTRRAPPRDPIPALPPIAPEPPMRDPGPRQPGRGLRYEIGGIEEVKQIDWAHVGVAVRKATADLRKFAREVMESGRFVPGDSRLLQAEASLVRAGGPVAAKVFSTVRDAEGRISPFLTHPAWESNALAATLDAWGLPLTEAQEVPLRTAWAEHAKEWEKSRGDPAAEWSLDALVAATNSRRRLQRELERVLDDQQRRALWPEEIRGRAGLDLFSPTMLWADRVLILPIEGDDDAIEHVATALCDMTGTLDPDERRVAMDRARAWVAERPEDWAEGPRSYLGRLGYPREDELFPGLEGLGELVASFQPPPAGTGPVKAVPPNFRKIPVPIRMQH